MTTFEDTAENKLMSSLTMFAVVAILSGDISVIYWTEAHWIALLTLHVSTSVVANVLSSTRNK